MSSKKPKPERPIGERLREWRENYAVTQADIARQIGVDAQSISNLESGRTKSLKTKNLQKLLQIISAAPGAGDPRPELPRDLLEILDVSARRLGMTPSELFARLMIGAGLVAGHPAAPGSMPPKSAL